MKILSKNFFDRPTLVVAKQLLGKFLIRKIGSRKIVGMITEVEAYVGFEDKASHASRGLTERTKVMFGKPGQWYVYMIYGMYHCLNVVTERRGFPAAVLIRSIALIKYGGNYGSPTSVVAGPGRVCKHFQIDRKVNKKVASRRGGLWIEDGGIKISSGMIRKGKRIGVDYAGVWKNKLWRFYL